MKLDRSIVFQLAKGFRGRAKNVWRISRMRVEKALQHMYRARKEKKRNYRTLWIQRVNAATREHGVSARAAVGADQRCRPSQPSADARARLTSSRGSVRAKAEAQGCSGGPRALNGRVCARCTARNAGVLRCFHELAVPIQHPAQPQGPIRARDDRALQLQGFGRPSKANEGNGREIAVTPYRPAIHHRHLAVGYRP